MDGAYIDKAVVDKAYLDETYIDRTCTGGVYIDRAYINKAYNIIYSKSPSVPLGNSEFIYIKGPIKLKILLSLNKVKNLLGLI